jgi:hypothetical protein
MILVHATAVKNIKSAVAVEKFKTLFVTSTLKGNFPYDGILNFLGKEAVRIRNPNLKRNVEITE